MTRKKRGPKPQGGVGVMVRMPPASIAPLDRWIAEQADAPSRPEAIRRLIEAGLKAAARAKAPVHQGSGAE